MIETSNRAYQGYDKQAGRGTLGAISAMSGASGRDADCAANACAAPERLTLRTTVEVRAERNFADALMHAMSGGRITRHGWNAGGQHVESQYPDLGSRMSRPYLVLKNAQGDLVPWVPSQGDLFANDWAMLPA